MVPGWWGVAVPITTGTGGLLPGWRWAKLQMCLVSRCVFVAWEGVIAGNLHVCLELGDPLGSMTGAARGGSWNERTVTDILYVCWEQVDATKSSWLEPSCTPTKMLSDSMRKPWQGERIFVVASRGQELRVTRGQVENATPKSGGRALWGYLQGALTDPLCAS